MKPSDYIWQKKLDCFQLQLDGLSLKQIAECENLSYDTVREYLKNVRAHYQKIGIPIPISKKDKLKPINNIPKIREDTKKISDWKLNEKVRGKFLSICKPNKAFNHILKINVDGEIQSFFISNETLTIVNSLNFTSGDIIDIKCTGVIVNEHSNNGYQRLFSIYRG